MYNLCALSLRLSSRHLHLSRLEMAQAMTVHFLGTSSGGGPSESRNCSSLVVDCLKTGQLWSITGTTRQFAFQPHDTPLWLKPQNVSKMFITHLHADHILGITGFLRNVLFAPSIDPNVVVPANPTPRIEIYGPAGIRNFVRSTLIMTLTSTAEKFVVHELLSTDDAPTPCSPEVMHSSELVGRDIHCTEDGFWRNFTQGEGVFGDVVVDAGPILHRDPCLGYIFRETGEPKRKLVILGDTYDADPIIPLCREASLLIHEATEAHIPSEINPQYKRSLETVQRVALARGHSIPQQAGAFAKTIGLKSLFPAPRYERDKRVNVMREIERQATEAWDSGRNAIAAYDFMRVAVPAPASMAHASRMQQVSYADPSEGLVYVDKRSNKRKR
ncbi:beta-lactamase-like protein [Roridomyces roridus]|uniref:Beta-lactamase-like protein n=1 Tax=Roridomyces roridus TaxID=1738132 RepID=A0AAD7FM48_9AGAR|nr:beta-lactamase-like protein [Roridomyces roridus]